jgi:hypothetical protein
MDTQLSTIHEAKKFRIACFSSVHDSVLMWSHYADHHRGFIVGIDTSDIQDILHEVTYSEKYPTLKEVNDAQEKTQLHALFLARKHPDWHYEKEWRIILQDTDPLLKTDPTDQSRFYLQLPPQSIREIYTGYSKGETAFNFAVKAQRHAPTIKRGIMKQDPSMPYKIRPHRLPQLGI